MEKQEQEELNILTGKGYEFETILFGKITKWHTGKMTLGKMLKMSDVFIKMNINQEDFEANNTYLPFVAQYEAVKNNSKICIDAIYIAIETEFPKWIRKLSFFYEPLIKKHLLNSIDSKDLLNFTNKMLENSDYQSFITSTVLMNGNRPTKAIPIEKTV
jgi:hypothetical protein